MSCRVFALALTMVGLLCMAAPAIAQDGGVPADAAEVHDAPPALDAGPVPVPVIDGGPVLDAGPGLDAGARRARPDRGEPAAPMDAGPAAAVDVPLENGGGTHVPTDTKSRAFVVIKLVGGLVL